MKSIFRVTALATMLTGLSAFAQTAAAPAPTDFFSKWQARATAIQAKQPGWAVPVISPYPMLIQVFRTEFVRQIAPAGTSTWNYGNTKGVNLIPFANTEFDFLIPPYIQHNTKAKDGFGDASAIAKYRILSGNEQHGSYILSATLTATIPTGSYSNGNKNATVVPALSGGKGFGKFDLQSSLGATLPVINGATAGRPIAWNSTAQYHLSKIIWPEVEDNATFYEGGANDGKKQNFVAPGLLIGKYKLKPSDPKSRLGLAAGAAFQIATSEFHSYNHGLYFTSRFLF
jgi:hypothetical protein